jgi:DNA-binding CsgD family transcriptional regulator
LMTAESTISPAVVGTINASFLVERVSGDAAELFGLPVSRVTGSSLLDLVARDYIAACKTALSSASEQQSAVNLQLGLCAPSWEAVLVQACFIPLQPASSCAFIFLPLVRGRPHGPLEARLSAILLNARRGPPRPAPLDGGSRNARSLTARENEIVTWLLDGDRVPAIAAKLFLSQSTVRNHLASVFAKVGVSSQQQLVDSFR